MLHALGVIILAAAFFVFTLDMGVIDSLVQGADGYDIEYDLNQGKSNMDKKYPEVQGEHTVPVEEPTKEKFHFKGWLAVDKQVAKKAKESEDGLDSLNIDDWDIYYPGSKFKPTTDTTMVALWDVQKYRVTYDTNEGSGEFKTQRVDYAIESDLTPYTLYSHEPERIGHSFKGWLNNKSEDTHQAGDEIHIESDVLLTAQWSLDSYDVKYHLNGGKGSFNNDEIKYDHDFKIQTTEPTREGYTFKGWEDQSGKTHQPGDTIVIKGKTDLTAQWSVNSYNIKYDKNGGNGNYTTEKVDFGKNHTVDTKKPTRKGYTFKGWENSVDGEIYNPGDKFKVAKGKNITLKAQWDINYYNVSFDLNKGNGSFPKDNVKYDTSYNTPKEKPTRIGYTFNGWKNSVTGKTVDAGSSIKITENTKLTAQWSINSYTVKYDKNGGSGSFKDVSLNYKSEHKINESKPTRKGYTFKGWKNNVDNKQYQPGETLTVTKDTTLKAEWSINDYTISFDLNGGKGSFSSQKQTFGQSYAIKNTKPTRTGHTFKGWKRSDNGGLIQSGQSFKVQGDTKLTAQWDVNKYTISYDLSGGSGTFKDSTHNYGVNHTVHAGKPKRTGYVFEGWERDDNKKILKSGDTFKVERNMMLKAKWSAEKYTIKYNANGGSGAPGNQSKIYGKDLKLSGTKPSRSGYRFDGWTKSSSGSGTKYKEGATYKEEGNQTLYAKWVKTERYIFDLYNVNPSRVTSNAYGFGGNLDFHLTKGQKYYFEPSGSVNQEGIDNGKYLRVYLYEPSWDYGRTSIAYKTTSRKFKGGSFTPQKSGRHRLRGYHYPRGGSRAGESTLYSARIYQYVDGSSSIWENTDRGTVVTLPKPEITRDNHLFDGWTIKGDGNQVYQPGDKVTINDESRFVAKWIPKEYSIKYNTNGGSGGPGDTNGKNGANFTVNHSTIARKSGQVFAGWKNSRDGKIYSPGAQFKLTGNTTLTAQYKPIGNVKRGVRIRIRKGAKYYDQGTSIPSFVAEETYYVRSIGGKRVVFGRGASSSTITGTISIDDIILQSSSVVTYGLNPMSLMSSDPIRPYIPAQDDLEQHLEMLGSNKN